MTFRWHGNRMNIDEVTEVVNELSDELKKNPNDADAARALERITKVLNRSAQQEADRLDQEFALLKGDYDYLKS